MNLKFSLNIVVFLLQGPEKFVDFTKLINRLCRGVNFTFFLGKFVLVFSLDIFFRFARDFNFLKVLISLSGGNGEHIHS